MKISSLLFIFLIFAIHSRAQENTIIVKVNYVYLDLSKINDKSLVTFQFKDILNSEGLMESNRLKQTYPEILNFTTKKGFPNLTSRDTVFLLT